MKNYETLVIDMKDGVVTEEIKLAAELIKNGEVVAFPTETVYGLGADALNPKAVGKIFLVKGRPSDNPLIIHIAQREDLSVLTSQIPDLAELLISEFWPGPLTLVLPRSLQVPSVTTGGLDTVAVRMPDHPVALALIASAGLPIAAPSANLSGRPSPTRAEHVLQDFNGRIRAVIDGGSAEVGIESTVIDLSSSPPTLLRPGGVTVEDLDAFFSSRGKKFKIASGLESELEKYRRSPGMRYKHYAPEAELVIVEGSNPGLTAGKIEELLADCQMRGLKPGLLLTDDTAQRIDLSSLNLPVCLKFMGPRTRPVEIACRLFALLREFDQEQVDLIIAEGISTAGLGFAVMNRLRKAAGYNIVKV